MDAIIKYLLILLVVVLIVGSIFKVTQPVLNDTTTPERIPTYGEVVPGDFTATNVDRVLDYRDSYKITKPTMKISRIATAIVTEACSSRDIECRLTALYEWTQANIEHTEVLPTRDHIISPEETIVYRQGNDLTRSILLASLMRSEGIPAQIAYTPYVVWVETTINNQRISLDVGCPTCRLGTTRFSGSNETIEYIA